MNYTQEQKDLLLEKLFDGVVCLNIYRDIDIRHNKFNYSYYRPKSNRFLLNWDNIWRFFENENADDYLEIKDLTEAILRDLTKQKGLLTDGVGLLSYEP